MQKIINLKGRETPYTLTTKRKNRTMRLAVRVGGDVTVTAPGYIRIDIVERFLMQKADWILRKIEHLRKFTKTSPIKDAKVDYEKYKAHADTLIHRKIKDINFAYNFSFGRITIRNQKSRWGSCSRKGDLNFNYKIIFLPDRLVDYIVAHELCHLGEFNHSKDFWNLVARTIPEYRDLRKRLRQIERRSLS